jgi:Bacterial alpha-L-rhamnosidase 6 hairpin glycosidase domain/Alpha-L-rhamnosidase N-terminal domain/Bacterial alpha-L-rhamnosidase concanavalin-like domain/Bacterial alpha-L-rhamnosidase C-terminal domain/3-keto-disaccharide hydrolase
MRERLRRRAPSSHRSGPTIELLTRRLRVGVAGVLPVTLVVLTLTGASVGTASGAHSSRQLDPVAQASSPAPLVGSLTTEHMTDPLGIGASHPLLGWVITSAARGVSQSKYEIRVAENENGLVSGQDLVWDSKIVDSGQSFDVPYGGPALAPEARYYWQVRVWDNYGNVSPWSTPARFETAFLDPGQFQGSWVGQYPDSGQQNATKGELLFRKQFTLANTITRARLYLAGLSYPYTDINGRPVSDHVLDTAFTEYGKKNYWQVQQGAMNAAGGEAGILKEGSDWTDYTMAFSTSIVSAQSGWVVRAQSPDTNYLLILDTNDDAGGPKDALQEVVDQSGSYHVISDIPLPFAVTAGTWYAVKTVVAGSSVTTWINGMQVASFDSSNLPSGVQPIAAGTVGFREDTGEQASFKDLSVTSPSGATLFSSPLDQASDLNAFAVPGANGGATVDYTTYDVTRLLHTGANALAVSLGHGFYAGGADDYPASGEPWQPTQPKLKAELDVWYANGTSAQVVSDGTWKVTTGPTTADSPATENYDARLEKPGWTQAGYDDSGWSTASVVSAPAGVLRAQLIPPIEKTATINPVTVTNLPGVNLPVPSYTGTPIANWIWNTAGATNSTPQGTIYMRKTFTVADPSSVSSAVLRVNADDGHMTYVNGTLVSSSPGNVVNAWQTSQISDIKSLLVPGTNVIAIAGIATDTGANSVIAAAQLDTTRIVTDGTWKALPGTPASPPAGWNTTGFDDSSWPAAIVQGPYGISPWGTNIQTPPGPSKVYDFGTITSGWTRIMMQGAAGTQVQIRYSEQLNPDGTVQSEGGGSQTDTYILKGGGPETYEPKYGWKGYRYVQVSTNPQTAGSSPPPLPDILSIQGVEVHTALPTAGDFNSSSDLLNRMHVAMRNTILNNQYSYGSDTPTYEKGGWTNDNGDYSTSEMANFDAEAYYQHMMQNFDDAQASSGNVGWLVPTPPGDQNDVDPLWGGSYLLIEYNMFENYEGLAVIRRDYSYMAAYMDYMASLIAPTGYIYMKTTWGDWSVPGNATPPSSEMLGSMFLYREAKDLAIMAAAIGNTAGASKYDELASNIRAAVNSQFYDPAFHEYYDPPGTVSQARGGPSGPTGCTPGGSVPCGYDQTANVIGLAFGLAPAQDQKAIAAGLTADVVAKGDHLATGANGSKFILPMLTENGQGDLAYKVATNPTSPGWGQWFLQCGATTMWESWENSSCTAARSRDHAFMGTVDDWLFEDVAGIQPTSPGFRTVRIEPYPVGDLTSASAYETTPLGRVSSNWTRSGTSFALTVGVPVGSQASVCVPATSAQSVTESGDPIGNASGVTVIGMQGSCLQLQLGSGTYRFHSTTP